MTPQEQIIVGVSVLIILGIIGAAVSSYLKTIHNETRIDYLEDQIRWIVEKLRDN